MTDFPDSWRSLIFWLGVALVSGFAIDRCMGILAEDSHHQREIDLAIEQTRSERVTCNCHE